jgi:hypothetical protein
MLLLQAVPAKAPEVLLTAHDGRLANAEPSASGEAAAAEPVDITSSSSVVQYV